MIDFDALNAQMRPLDAHASRQAHLRWNSIAKPIGGLGQLEAAVERIVGIMGSADVCISKRAVIVMCADNGVVCEGVSQSQPDVTTVVAGNIARHVSSVCTMAAPAHIDVIGVDVGMRDPVPDSAIWSYSVARSTANIACGAAMTPDRASRAIEAGIDVVRRAKEAGYQLICTGEMAIANTTTSSAMTSVLLGLPVEEVTGVGAGLDDAGLARKVEVIKRAIAVNQPDAHDAFDVLVKLGGFDIAGMVGEYLGAALFRVPIVIDGVISALSAYVAATLCPACAPFMLASHVSAEPAAALLLKRLDAAPIIHAGLHLGEGTGAILLVPLLDMTLGLYNGASFADVGMDAYKEYASSNAR